MEVAHASSILNVPKIRPMIQTLHDVGLDYTVGAALSTLSGGERSESSCEELVRRGTGKTSTYDEPTTGLHFEDTRKLLDVLHGFVKQGNTVLIEHNLDVIKTADWIVDMGPEGSSAASCQGMPAKATRSKDPARAECSHR